MTLVAATVLAFALQEAQIIEEGEFAADYLKVVRAFEAAEKLSKTSPAAALESLEKDVLPNLPKVVETTIIVKFSKGLTKGEEKERHAFYPYRLAGECALAVDRPDRAVTWLAKSPGSAATLERAKKALAEKEKSNATAPPPPPPPAVEKFTVAPLLEKRDFAGALEALRKERERLKDYDARVKEVRDETARHVRTAAASLAAALPRLNQPDFRKDHLEPCLESCARVPAELETEELRFIRRLAAWMAKPDAAGLEPLALDAARLDSDYHVVCEQAQKSRLAEVETLVDEARRAARADRQGVLERLEAAERAFRKLAAARRYKELDDALERALSRRPIDNLKLNEARKGAASVREIRVLASQLDLIWTSAEQRAPLGDQDLRDLAVYLGIYRCYALFLDGKSIEEAARDPRIIEVFRSAPALPKDVSPKVAGVLERVRSGK